MELLEYWQDNPPVAESLAALVGAYTERRPRATGIVSDGSPSDRPPERRPGDEPHMAPDQIAANMRAMGGSGLPASALPPAVREAIAKCEAERAKRKVE